MHNETTDYIPDNDTDLIDALVEVTKDFPAPPLVLTRILELTSQPDVSIEKIEQVISSDAGTAAKILRLSNSAFYGRSRNIASIKDAIMLLGIHTVRSLVVASGTYGLYNGSGALGSLKQRMWEHSLATAVLCKMLARHYGIFQPEEAFLAGLLHDVGKLVLLQRFPDKYLEIIQPIDRDAMSALALEMEIFQFNHQQVGSALVDDWLLPENLVIAIGQHHNFKDADSLPGLTAIADAIVASKGYNILASDPELGNVVEEFDLAELVQQFEEEYREQSQLFVQ
ncbi:MAG: HDOD domain-containing protein [Deferribacteres bacterium]|nr:HDOD domain-containing protein [candidate division KSB1 bacterium]MCB9504439.1 HDOD domain-containing protein [Deferribacteres bacterium]